MRERSSGREFSGTVAHGTPLPCDRQRPGGEDRRRRCGDVIPRTAGMTSPAAHTAPTIRYSMSPSSCTSPSPARVPPLTRPVARPHAPAPSDARVSTTPGRNSECSGCSGHSTGQRDTPPPPRRGEGPRASDPGRRPPGVGPRASDPGRRTPPGADPGPRAPNPGRRTPGVEPRRRTQAPDPGRRPQGAGPRAPNPRHRGRAQASSAAIRSAGEAWIGCGPAMSMNTVVMASRCVPRNARSHCGDCRATCGGSVSGLCAASLNSSRASWPVFGSR